MSQPAPTAPSAAATLPDRNRLGDETSPYLLQHRDNPVHWQPWDVATLAVAKTAGKPILLSVGYAACHWCHVMAHESFEDAETAALMNELFVNIKVDREERPDLDTIYQHALALLGQQGGWPLTMFLTPEGAPFWGGTYFPPTDRYGRPGFRQVLQAIAELYAKEPGKIAQNVTALREGLGKLARPQGGGGIDLDLTDQVAQRIVRLIDPVHGGIEGAPKFPQVPNLELLWRAWKRTNDSAYRDAVGLSLTRMSQGGIYDHLGGGFARYSTDAEWLAPHFEKMLYDNAQLLELLTLVWQETRDPLFEARVRETAGWVLREMLAAPGREGHRGFASTLDADSEGEEGRFYVWTEAEIDAVLGPDTTLFKRVYDVTPGGNWEGHTILNRSANLALRTGEEEAALHRARQRLLAVRDGRVRPGWDDKVLADWNGLMIAALARAARVFGEPGWLAAAADAFAFVRTEMSRGGRLLHSWRGGEPRHPATLEDYAQMSRAALALHEATGEAPYLAAAEGWVEVLDKHYWDTGAGGYFFAADDTADLITRPKSAADNATPSGNGAVVGVLARLFYLNGKDAYRARAEALVAAFSGEVPRNYFSYATLLGGNELLQKAVQVVLVGRREEPETQALLGAVLQRSLPNAIVTIVAPEAALPASHPAHGKAQLKGKATAYICRGPTCSMPIAEPKALAAALALG